MKLKQKSGDNKKHVAQLYSTNFVISKRIFIYKSLLARLTNLTRKSQYWKASVKPENL